MKGSAEILVGDMLDLLLMERGQGLDNFDVGGVQQTNSLWAGVPVQPPPDPMPDIQDEHLYASNQNPQTEGTR